MPRPISNTRPANQPITIKSEGEIMEEVLQTLIRCSRTSIIFGWNDLAEQLYASESILEQMIHQN
jgi:hypothetical protein